MEIMVIRTSVTKADLNTMAKQQFGDMVKAVVDVEQGIYGNRQSISAGLKWRLFISN